MNGEWECYKSGDEKEDGRYVGKIENGVPNGNGKETWYDEWKYFGEWKDAGYNGQGTTTFLNGLKVVWKWKNGKPWNGAGYDKDGNILGNYINEEMIK